MKPDDHPSPDLLRDFVLGGLSRRQSALVLQHLLAGCKVCGRVTRDLWSQMEQGFRASREQDNDSLQDLAAYDAVVGRALDQVATQADKLRVEQSEAETAFTELVTAPPARRAALVAANLQYQTWSLCSLLINKSFARRYDSPQELLELAELAELVSRQVSAHEHGASTVQDLRGRSWTNLANAQRVVGDFRSAKRSFARAERLLRAGTGDPAEEVKFLYLKAIFENSVGKARQAVLLLDRVIQMSKQIGDEYHLAWASLDKGNALGALGDFDGAIILMDEARRVGASLMDERLSPLAQHNTVHWLIEGGRFEEAYRRVEPLRSAYRLLGDRMNLIRLRWMEGRIEVGLHHLDAAATVFTEVREAFVRRSMAYDAALASLDLALVFATQGRRTEMRRLAEEMLPIFQSRDVHREAMAALIIFRQAVEAEQATAALIREVVGYLEKARGNPGLQFRLGKE